MSQSYYGSIDVSKIIEMAKIGDPAFSKGANGKIYMNLNIWVNDEPDQYGNSVSLQSNFKDATKDQRFYFGNAKKSERKEPEQLQAGDPGLPETDDLPF